VTAPDPALEATRRGQFANLPRRLYLTFKHHGARTVLRRAVTFPLRFTPAAQRLGIGRVTSERRAVAKRWFAANARPVTVVIPSFGAAEEVARAVRSVRRTVPAGLVRVIVTDDAGPEQELARLREIEGVELIEGEGNLGFAGNVNRGLERAGAEHDVVLLNADVEAWPGWLASLQWAAYEDRPAAGVLGARLLYPNGQIQHAGVLRNPQEPEWFDHRFRFAPGEHGPADVPGPVLAVTGACMYIKRDVIEAIGRLDPGYEMAFEDVDFCLRAWEAGFEVRYEPGAILTHAESTTRPREPGARELAAQRRFWKRWGPWFDEREVGNGDRLTIVYVTEGTEVGGGHRLIFEYLNRLSARGYDVTLFTLGPKPDWFELRVPVRTFPGYEALVAELAPLHAIKVATWWKTAEPVWLASVLNGIPVYYVQDLETSYYPDGEHRRHQVLASYREEFRYLTISGWIREQLAGLGHDAELLTPGIDHETFRPLPDRRRREDVILAIGRANRLKRLELTIGAWRALPAPRPELWLFGVEPEVVPTGAKFVPGPSDAQVNELLNECAVFVLTSSHEGFALPPLEAMAAGAAVVCTDAHGNRDYCRDGVNCLMPAPEPKEIARAIARLLGDPELRRRLGSAGLETARDYGFGARTDTLERFLRSVAKGSRPPAAPRG
jgi:GT2 family glycosyltransferase/glycosyltransferase involved in cell wall biosynthesis